MSIVILDNGAGTVKAGVISSKDSGTARCPMNPPVIVPNAIAKPGNSSSSLIGDQISQFCQSSNGGTYLHFTRPFER